MLASLRRRGRALLGRRPLSIYKSKLALPDVPKVALTEYLVQHFHKYGEKVMVVDGLTGAELRFCDFGPRVSAAATKLGAATNCFGAGDSLMIFAPNCIEYPIAFHAALVRGGVATTANPAYTPAELAHQIRDSSVRHLLTSAAGEATAREALKLAGSDASVSVLGEPGAITSVDVGDAPPGADLSFSLASRASTVPDDVDLRLRSAPFDATKSIAVIPYSSGTTGVAKGVLLTHHNLVANLVQVVSMVHHTRQHMLPHDSVFLCLLPMFHIYGMTAVSQAMLLGHTLVSLPGFTPETFLDALEKHRVTWAYLVPPLILFLAKSPLVDAHKLRYLKVVTSGAAPLDAAVQLEAANRVDIEIFQAYGLTETSPAVLIDPAVTPGTSGQLVPGTEAMLKVDVGDLEPPVYRDALVGEAGEAWFRGPQVMRGYVNRPDATAACVTPDGWLQTGDAATIDAEGNFRIVDRIKELIKVKGLQVAPAELEGLLLTHADVADAAVVPQRDDRAGELPHAFVVLKAGRALDAAAVCEFIKGQTAPHKWLGGVTFSDAIPKSASGKILRRILRDQLAQGAALYISLYAQ